MKMVIIDKSELNNRSNQIMAYYTNLVWENLPLKEETKNLLKTTEYVFTAYITKKQYHKTIYKEKPK